MKNGHSFLPVTVTRLEQSLVVVATGETTFGHGSVLPETVGFRIGEFGSIEGRNVDDVLFEFEVQFGKVLVVLTVVQVDFVGRFAILVLDHGSGNTDVFGIIQFENDVVSRIRLPKVVLFSEEEFLGNGGNLRSADDFEVVLDDEVAFADVVLDFPN